MTRALEHVEEATWPHGRKHSVLTLVSDASRAGTTDGPNLGNRGRKTGYHPTYCWHDFNKFNIIESVKNVIDTEVKQRVTVAGIPMKK